MRFEYDENKSLSNKLKHGIDFEEAQLLWLNRRVTIRAISNDEPRWMTIGMIEEKYWTAFYTIRGYDIIRLISVRRSREQEEDLYEEKIPQSH